MKATLAKLLPVLLLASSCSTGVYLSSGNSDDVYYSPADEPVVISKRIEAPAAMPEKRMEAARIVEDTVRVAPERYTLVDSVQAQYQDEEYVPSPEEQGYYQDDDFYYGSRINRFYRPYMGFGYYDPWYSGFGMGYGYGYGYSGFYDPWYSDFYSPFGYYGSYYNPWYSSYYSPWHSRYYGYGYSPWYSGYYWNDWGYNNIIDSERYSYGPRRSMRTDGINGDLTGRVLKTDPLYARGQSGYSGNSGGSGVKSTATAQPAVQRSSSDPKSESRPSGYRSGISTPQDRNVQSGTQTDRSYSSSYIRSRTGSGYNPSNSQGATSLGSSPREYSSARSSYVRPKTSGPTGQGMNSAGSYRSSSSGATKSYSGSPSYSGSSAPRSSGSSGSSFSGSSSYRSSSSGSVSSGSSSGRSSSSSMSSGSSSSRSGGGSSSSRR